MAAPTSRQVSSASADDGTVTLSWDTADYVDVWRHTGDGQWQRVAQGATGGTWQDTGLTDGGTFYYRLTEGQQTLDVADAAVAFTVDSPTVSDDGGGSGEIDHGSDLIGTSDVVGIAGLGLTENDLQAADPGFLFDLDEEFVETFADDEDDDGTPIITARSFGDGRHFISKSYAGAVLFRGCWWDGQVCDRNIASELRFEHCDWDIRWAGTDATQLSPVNASKGYIYRTRIRGYGVGPVCGGDLKVTESMFTDIAPFANDAHMSGGNLQFNASNGFEFRRNLWLVGHSEGDAGTGISGGFVCYNDATHTNATFADNYLSGGGYPLNVVYLSERSGAQQSGFTITGNIFGREYFRFSGFHPSTPNPIFNDATGSTVSGNLWGPRGPHWQSGDPEEGDPIG